MNVRKHWADRLTEAVKTQGHPLCVGLDPRWEMLPDEIRQCHSGQSLHEVAAAFEEFCTEVLDLIADRAMIIKPQMAFFESCGPSGLAALQRLNINANDRGMIVILDAKRGDIASTATAYAEAALSSIKPVWAADSVTVNPYLGEDALEPFLQVARREAKGLFVLAKTSNPGAGLFQDLLSQGQPLHEYVVAWIARQNRQFLGECGRGDVGAVVGATKPEQLARLRKICPEAWFLVPGYGAQGGHVNDIMPARCQDGFGVIVNSSRGITFPFKPADPRWRQENQKCLSFDNR